MEYLPDENRSISLIDPSTLSSLDLSEIEIGKRFAVGGEAHMYWGVWKPYCMKVVVKVLKVLKVSHVSIRHLRIWRRQMQKMISLGLSGERDLAYVRRVLGFCITKDLHRYVILEPLGCDLRTLIDVRMRNLSDEQMPFSHKCALGLMLFIALGVRALHRHGMVHGDLKSINVLCKESMQIHGIADLNIVIGLPSLMQNMHHSKGLISTIFFLPLFELIGIRNSIRKDIKQKLDVYAFAMLCYEILTGQMPFEGHPQALSGNRPYLPPYVSRDVRELLQRCWHGIHTNGPTFQR
jgi:serine/threonine protein kinase